MCQGKKSQRRTAFNNIYLSISKNRGI